MPVSATGATNITASIKELGDQVAISSGSSINGTSDDLVALVGDQMASTNNLSVGSTFTLYGKTITVKGILADSSSSTNSSDSTSTDTPGRGRNLSIGSALILPLATLQNLSGKTDQISSITATVDNVSNTDAVVSAITTKLGTDSDGNNRADVTSDKANAQTAIDSLAGIKTTSLFSLIACAVAAIVIIFLAMLMIVRERRQEIGVLKAVGAGAGTIIKQFVAESLTLTLLAGVIGLGVGVIAAGPLTSSLTKSTSSSSQTASNNMPGQPGQNTPSGSTNPDSDQTKASSADANRGNFMARGFDRIGTISAQINWWIVLWALGAAVLIAAVGATAASLFAMRVKPAEAVRAE
jgi:putative ABC transport system permease protein